MPNLEPRIYCDEAGNSGENLLDPHQPAFALASNDLTLAEASEALTAIHLPRSVEPKFKVLKKTATGIRSLKRLLRDPSLTPERVIVTVFDKRYMVVTKLVDLVAETLMHHSGIDLYERGANIAMSNMLYYCMPAFCGTDATDRFLGAFVTMMRARTPESIDAYYTAGAELAKASKDEEFRRDLFPLVERRLFHDWFDGIGELSLDPAIPSLFQHMAIWSARKPERFQVLHDSSKPVLASEAQFRAMMAQGDEMSRTIGYDRRRFSFPLRASSLEQANSREHPSIQVADICAGAIVHFMKARLSQSFDELAEFVRDEWLDRVVDAIAPTAEVSPAQLGTDEMGGTNPVDEMVQHLGGAAGFDDPLHVTLSLSR